jgi:hypothetical protein
VTTVRKLFMIAVLVTLAAEGHAETSVLRSLPTATQKKIENIRTECRGADLTTTSGDEGLSPFTLSGAQAVCPVRNKNDPTAWKREKCDFVVKWDGTKFVWKPL